MNCYLISKGDSEEDWMNLAWHISLEKFIELNILDGKEKRKCYRCKSPIVCDFIIKERFPQYSYMRSLYQLDTCFDCLSFQETDFVSGMEDRELPLYINHTWVTYLGYDVYMARLKNVASV